MPRYFTGGRVMGQSKFPWGTRPKRDPTIWKTKDGQTMPIVEMKDSHIQRAVAMLKRGMYASQIEKWPVYQNLIAEAVRRNIDVDGNWDL